MPMYSYHCEPCDLAFDEMGRIAEHRSPQACPSCGALSPRTLEEFPGFILVGDGWPGKNHRIRGQMARKNERLASKEREQKGDGMVPSLVPNVDGERTDSWADATKLARSQGRDASGYETYARKEKAGGT
jgi:putative FmdB family regulatory protein